MNIVQMNATYNVGSTGKIMSDLNDVVCRTGSNGFMVSGYYHKSNIDNLYCTSHNNPLWEIKKNLLISRITGTMGYRYLDRTESAIHWIDEKNPDIIHLHNIHGNWIHLETLFNYIKKRKIPVVWTLHDCWAFTGRCSHFELCGCNKWKSQCYNCVNTKVYPITYFFDKSKKMFLDKKKWFSGIENMTIVTPSKWLADYVKQSFLGDYPIEVIHNGIDINMFSPSENKSKYCNCVGNKKIILGVASSWSQTKGLFDFLKLDSLIKHDQYQIVMVGLNEKQLRLLPKSIIGISRTNNQKELVDLYSDAFVFVNPTYQDNFPTTNLEALSCGTPVITYNTGGCPEAVTQQVGAVIKKGDVEGILKAIKEIENVKKESCRFFAQEHFDKFESYKEYINLYKKLLIKKI